jgi:hypothetical protein
VEKTAYPQLLAKNKAKKRFTFYFHENSRELKSVPKKSFFVDILAKIKYY